MIEEILENLLKEIGIAEEIFVAQIEKGINGESHKKIFE